MIPLINTRSISDAVLSNCKKYRYVLRRIWNASGPVLVWVMLNPSTADASYNDPTIKKCIKFARKWGYGGIVVVNLFAWRATKPKDLPPDLLTAIGPDNRMHRMRQVRGRKIILAWGAHNTRGIGPLFVEKLRMKGRHGDLLCLGVTEGGQPRHPLFVKDDTVAVPYVG